MRLSVCVPPARRSRVRRRREPPSGVETPPSQAEKIAPVMGSVRLKPDTTYRKKEADLKVRLYLS